MKAYKETERKYYKYQYNSWTQPSLTSNGVFTVDDFAVQGYDTLWKAFDYDKSTNVTPQTTTTSQVWFNKNPLKIAQLEIATGAVDGYHGAKQFSLYGSNDYSNWDLITTQDTTNRSQVLTTYEINSNSYYKYHKFTTNSSTYIWTVLATINIIGEERVTVESTEEDYDFYKDFHTYKLPRELDSKYFKPIYEQAVAGEYEITLDEGNYLVELVGAGGGCAGCRWASNVGNGNTMLSGGSGAYFKGILHVPAGTYTITVGAGKLAVTADVNTLTTAEAGGDTSFDSLITAGGGQGGQASFSTRIAGVGGVCSINTSIIENIDTRNGNTGREAGNAIYTFTTVTGGVSAYDNSTTGYGAGGGYPDGGIDGYCKIMQQTTEDDSTTSEIKYTYYGII